MAKASEHFFYVLKCSDNSYYGAIQQMLFAEKRNIMRELDVNIQKHVAR